VDLRQILAIVHPAAFKAPEGLQAGRGERDRGPPPSSDAQRLARRFSWLIDAFGDWPGAERLGHDGAPDKHMAIVT
jgi:hypothetical protein